MSSERRKRRRVAELVARGRDAKELEQRLADTEARLQLAQSAVGQRDQELECVKRELAHVKSISAAQRTIISTERGNAEILRDSVAAMRAAVEKVVAEKEEVQKQLWRTQAELEHALHEDRDAKKLRRRLQARRDQLDQANRVIQVLRAKVRDEAPAR